MFLATATLIAVLLIIIAYYKISFQYWQKRNVPFVNPRIPWGNYINIFFRKIHFGQAVVDMYNDMKAQGHKYFGVYLFSTPCFIPIDPKYLKLILAKDFQYFHHRNLYYNEKDDPISAHLLALNGENWKRMRSKMSPTFTTGKIKMVFKIFIQCGKVLEDILYHHSDNRTPLNAKEMFSSFSTDVIVNCAFGLEVDMLRKNEFSKHTDKALDFSLVRCLVLYLGAAFPALIRWLGFRQIAKSAGDFFIDVVNDTVKYREKTKTIRNDFLQLLINIKNEGIDGEEFTIEQIAAQCFIFFLAGYETSATTMSHTLYEIASQQGIYCRLVEEIRTVLERYDGNITYEALQEMKYLGQIIDESLRKYSPAYTVSRTCTKRYKLPDSDVVLEKGTQIIIPIRALHFDPEYFEDPEKFDPERFSPDRKKLIEQYTYIPFGEGPRNCIGMRFGLLESKIALVMILTKFKLSVNERTTVPLQQNPKTLLLDAKGGIWLNCERLEK